MRASGLGLGIQPKRDAAMVRAMQAKCKRGQQQCNGDRRLRTCRYPPPPPPPPPGLEPPAPPPPSGFAALSRSLAAWRCALAAATAAAEVRAEGSHPVSSTPHGPALYPSARALLRFCSPLQPCRTPPQPPCAARHLVCPVAGRRRVQTDANPTPTSHRSPTTEHAPFAARPSVSALVRFCSDPHRSPTTAATSLPSAAAASCDRLSALSRQLSPPSPTTVAGLPEGAAAAAGAGLPPPGFITRRPTTTSGSSTICDDVFQGRGGSAR